jgi:hypothetical protein
MFAIVTSRMALRKPAGQHEARKATAPLGFVTQTLLVAIRPHAFAALVFGNFRFPSLLYGAHNTSYPTISFAEKQLRSRVL